MNIQQCFETLKLDRNASKDDAKHAHRKLAYTWHPDRHSDQPYLIQKRAEREMQKINVAYEMVLSFLSSEQERKRQAEVKVKAAAEAKVKVAQAEAKAAANAKRHRKIVVPKVILAGSFFIICFLLIIGYTMLDRKRPPLKHSEDSRLDPNDAKVYSHAPSAPTSPPAQKAVAVPEKAKPSKTMAGADAEKDKRIAKAVTVPDKPESSKPETGRDLLKEERIAKAVTVPDKSRSSKPESDRDLLKEERIAKAVTVPDKPESSKPETDRDLLKEERFSKAVTVADKPEPSKLEAGMDALKEERFAEAVALFEEILASDPSLINRVSGHYSRALQGQASKLVKTDPQKAKELLLTSVDLEPDSVQGHFRLGLLYVRLKDYPKAIDTYQKAADLDPQFPEIFFNLGYVYAIIKDYSRAKEVYGRVV